MERLTSASGTFVHVSLHTFGTEPPVSKRQSPYEIRYGRPPSLRHLRRFGVLCFAKVHTQIGPLQARAERCIFLGYSNANSSYLCGTWRKDDRVKRNEGYRFVVIESRAVKFHEDVTISNIEDLRPDRRGTFVEFDNYLRLGDFESPDSEGGQPVDPSHGLQPAREGISAPDFEVDSGSDDDKDGSPVAPPSKRQRLDGEIANSDKHASTPKVTELDFRSLPTQQRNDAIEEWITKPARNPKK